jgi:leader peptidase (prepilin peptidase) / N-methyltransferase
MESIYIYILVFLIGISVGSFLNVLIYRIPRKIKFGFDRSFCPHCKTRIKFYDNIPLLSYLILRGKCRACGKRISIRYPLIELLNGLAYVFFIWHYGLTLHFFVYSFLSSILIAIFFIDLDFQIIPDLFTIPGMVIGLGVSLAPGGIGIVASAIGLVVGGAVLYLVAELGDRLFKKESMGGGDIKMAAMLGAFLGWQKVVFIFFGSAVIGLVISIILMFFSQELRSKRVIPFGPFLAIAAVVAILYGDQIISFYLNNFLGA